MTSLVINCGEIREHRFNKFKNGKVFDTCTTFESCNSRNESYCSSCNESLLKVYNDGSTSFVKISFD